MRKRTGILFVIISVSLISSCHLGPAKEKPMEIDRMKMVMWDLMKADEWYLLTTAKDTLAKTKHENIRLYEQVFSIHAIKRDQFYNSLQFDEAHPLEMKVLMDSVEQYGIRAKRKLEDNNHGQAKPAI